MDSKYGIANLTLDEYDYSRWYKKLDLQPLAGDEEYCIVYAIVKRC